MAESSRCRVCEKVVARRTISILLTGQHSEDFYLCETCWQLLERGFTRFAYYGLRGIWFSHEMRQGFAQRLQQDGFDCEAMEVHSVLGSRRPCS